MRPDDDATVSDENHAPVMTVPSKALRGTAALNPRSTVLNHELPRSYACYLLRSFGRRTATYIGSTPDPPRRIKQHNGLIVGGAFKTRLGRPWEKELIVHGFPSKLQALQFEWAWQNPHASRHLHATIMAGSADATKHLDSIAAADSAPSASVTRPSAQFPKSSLSNRPQSKVQVLQYMLTSKPWTAFNLQVMLFSRDAQTWWKSARHRLGPVLRTEAALKKWEKSRQIEANLCHDDTQDPWGIDRGSRLDQVRVELREEGVDGERLMRQGQGAIEQCTGKVQIQDDALAESQWTKYNALRGAEMSPAELDSSSSPQPAPPAVIHCGLCALPIDSAAHLTFTLCTTVESCHAAHHLTCLASHMLLSAPVLPASSPATPDQAVASRPLLPTTGHCPSCDGETHWQDLVRGCFRRDERARVDSIVNNKKRRTRIDKAAKAPAKTSKVRGKAKTEAKAARNASPSDLESVVGEVFDMDSNDDQDQDDEDVDPDATEAERSFARLAELDSADELGDDGVISSDETSDDVRPISSVARAREAGTPASSPRPRKVGSPKKQQRATGMGTSPTVDSKKTAASQTRLGLASTKPALVNASSDKAKNKGRGKAQSPGKSRQKVVEYIELSDSD